MRWGKLTAHKSTMCRHPGIMKGRWRTISHLPNPGYSLQDCVELERLLLIDTGQKESFGSHLIQIVLEMNWTFKLRPVSITRLVQAEPAQRLHALVRTLFGSDLFTKQLTPSDQEGGIGW